MAIIDASRLLNRSAAKKNGGPFTVVYMVLQTPTQTTVTTLYPSSVIIVALTACSMECDRVAALAAGCNDLAK